ncbi:MAG: hypothetical protein WA708_08280 [Acidobacteriaceae bacterium]
MSATAPMPTHAHASTALSRELWISLASLLRSHVAMHSIARPAAPMRIAADSHSATLLGSRGKLIVLGPDASGKGSTEFRPEAGELGDEYCTFFFTEDGLVYIENSETALDMESAAEHWLRQVQL